VEIIKLLLHLLVVAYSEVITNKIELQLLVVAFLEVLINNPVLQLQVAYSEEFSNKTPRVVASLAANKIKLLEEAFFWEVLAKEVLVKEV
jgi:hypothetical protein